MTEAQFIVNAHVELDKKHGLQGHYQRGETAFIPETSYSWGGRLSESVADVDAIWSAAEIP
jgi:hypothetical protein